MSNWNRRRFLKSAATGGLGVALVPSFLTRTGLAFATPAAADPFHQIASDLNGTYFARAFGIDEAAIRQAIQAALGRGGEFADLFFQHRLSSYLVLEDGAVNRAYSTVELGVGVRVVIGDQTGYAFTEELTPESMATAARTAASIAAGDPRGGPESYKVAGHDNYYPIESAWSEVGVDRKIPFLEKINARIWALDPRVRKATVNFADGESRILVVTSDGVAVEDYQPDSYLAASVVAEENGRREKNSFSLAARNDINAFTNESIETVAKESVERTTRLLSAVKPPAGEMPVVLGAGGAGVLLHEAIGHGMEADFNRKGISIYADMIGRKIAGPDVTVVDNGTNPGVRGSINVDDEGNRTERTVLVEGGILRSYLHDRISAEHYKVAPTGSGRRESFRHRPMPRMRNTYMEPGPFDPAEIIRSVDRGIYCEEFSNGQVQIGAGDFSFYVSSGYLIEKGKLTTPIKDVNLIGNGPKVLESISMVGNDARLALGGWTCGKNGQSVPVGQGMPTVRVDGNVTVGGTDTGRNG